MQKGNKVHFVGITSPFPSFCAQLLYDKGVIITASELNQENTTGDYWRSKGVLYAGGHAEKYVTTDLDLVVFPNGPIPGNPECQKALDLGIKTCTVGELLGEITKDYKTIAVAGTHGKTTTTAAIVWILESLGYKPNFVLGGSDDLILGMDTNWKCRADAQYFVVEACEYKRQFLDRAPSPYITVITHIGLDHTDYYKDQEDYNSAFREFIGNTQEAVVIDAQGLNEQQVLKSLGNFSKKVIDVSKYRSSVFPIKSKIKGVHNQENLLRAFLACKQLGLPEKDVLKSLASFQGVSSRFEVAGLTPHGNVVIKDYAHNPEKVSACLTTAKQEYPDKRLIFIFQPHSYERTAHFKNEYAQVLSIADVVIIPNIYAPAREKDLYGNLIDAKGFVEYLIQKNANKEIYYTTDFEKTINKIKEIDALEKDNAVFVLASAGDLFKIVADLVQK